MRCPLVKHTKPGPFRFNSCSINIWASQEYILDTLNLKQLARPDGDLNYGDSIVRNFMQNVCVTIDVIICDSFVK